MDKLSLLALIEKLDKTGYEYRLSITTGEVTELMFLFDSKDYCLEDRTYKEIITLIDSIVVIEEWFG